jgi:hypothetical protein
MLPDKLAALGITGPDIGRLQREGRLVTGDRLVTVEQVSEPRRGQRFAFIMDTRLCDAAFALADRADMVVCESTFADTEAALAREYGHLTAGQAGRIAAESGTRLRSAARSCWPRIWTGSRCHPGIPPRLSRSRHALYDIADGDQDPSVMTGTRRRDNDGLHAALRPRRRGIPGVWISWHPDGFVINTYTRPSRTYLKLHQATCPTISVFNEAHGPLRTANTASSAAAGPNLKSTRRLGGTAQPCPLCL